MNEDFLITKVICGKCKKVYKDLESFFEHKDDEAQKTL